MPATKTVISFGLVAIPVALHAAAQESDIGFHQLHEADGARIRYKKVCEQCGKEVPQDEIVKGYAYEKNQHVTMTDAEIETIKSEKDRAIQLLHFVAQSQISPIYYQKAYHALPEPGGERAFELLRRALLEEGKIAVGKTVLGTKESLMAVLPREDGLVVMSLFFADEIKAAPQAGQGAAPQKQELEMAKTLVQSLDAPFDPADYHDEYQAKLRQLLAQKIAGQKITPAKKSGAVSVMDLMDALKQSVEAAGAKPKKSRARKP